MTKYIVKKGDTLGKISKQYLGNAKYYKDIMQTNDLSTDLVKPGQELIIFPKNKLGYSGIPLKFKEYEEVILK